MTQALDLMYFMKSFLNEFALDKLALVKWIVQ